MDSENLKIQVIERLAEFEQTVGKLYKIYAEKFPEHKAFWSDLVLEEENHANLINKITSIFEKTAHFDEGRFKISTLRNTLDYVKKEIDIALNEKMSLINALSVALSLEEGIIESAFYTVIKEDSIELKNLLQQIEAETKQHRMKIRELWTQEKEAKGAV